MASAEFLEGRRHVRDDLFRIGLGVDVRGDADRAAAVDPSNRRQAVGLFDPEGRSVDWVQFPAMATDIAYARTRDGWEDWSEVEDGTPGSEN